MARKNDDRDDASSTLSWAAKELPAILTGMAMAMLLVWFIRNPNSPGFRGLVGL